MTIDIKDVNVILANIINGHTRDYDVVTSSNDYDQETIVFDLKNGLFVKSITTTDSYGSEYISLIQFVEPTVKKVTDYQEVK